MTLPTYDESRPHPYIDPLQPNGIGLTDNTPGDQRVIRITVRNPIHRMRNGTRSGVVDWRATAEDLAKQLQATTANLVAQNKAVEQYDRTLRGVEASVRRIEGRERHLHFILTQVCTAWWFRWFASTGDKATLRTTLRDLGR